MRRYAAATTSRSISRTGEFKPSSVHSLPGRRPRTDQPAPAASTTLNDLETRNRDGIEHGIGHDLSEK
jgi:hypothetical protein